VLLLALLGLSVLAACTDDEPVPVATFGPEPDYWSTFPAEAVQAATLIRIIDGDTFEASLNGTSVTIRLFGADTPERGEACFREATNRLGTLLGRGDRVWLQPGPRNDDGSRLLRYAFTNERVLIDALLVREGLAVAWRRDGQLRDTIVALEDAARSLGVGCLFGR
jgi:micrococcal nuclease